MISTILFLAANPQDTDRIRFGREVEQIKEAIRRSSHRTEFELHSVLAIRPEDFCRAILDFKPQIIHFSGHGAGHNGILFENNLDYATPVTGESLGIFLELFSEIECVVLNACYTALQADLIATKVNYVIGISHEIEDQASIVFATRFYDAIGAGESIEFAYNFGLKAMAIHNISQLNTPILKIRKLNNEPTNIDIAIPLQSTASEILSTHLNKFLDRLIKNDNIMSIIYIDLDSFTGINKRFGTRIGDEVIQVIEKICQEFFKDYYYFRWIRDQFIVCLGGKNISDGLLIAECARKLIQEYDWNALVPDLYITASFGVAQRETEELLLEWILRAIQGAINAKIDGGNRVNKAPVWMPRNYSRRLEDYISL